MADKIEKVNLFSSKASVITDANAAVSGGVYSVNSSTQNVPEEVTAGMLVTFRRNDDLYLAQFFMNLYGEKLFYRTCDYGRWRSWKTIVS